MRALFLTKHGGPQSFQVRETPDPTPRSGQVRVRVRAAGINFAELLASQDLYPGAPKPPCVLGYEAAGVVDAVGDGVDAALIGKRVIALSNWGAHAELLCVPQRSVALMPEAMPFEEGAALPVNYITAYHMLHRVANARSGESLLIHQAAGGVGLAVLQLGRNIGGLTTFGTSSAGKHDLLRLHGCTHPIDYRTTDYAVEVRRLTNDAGVDIVLDALGGADWKKGYDLLKPCGRLICFGFANLVGGDRRSLIRVLGQVRRVPRFSPLEMMPRNRTVAGVNIGKLMSSPDILTEEMADLMRLYAAGAIKPHVDAAIPVADAVSAFMRLREGKNVGKVVLTF
jgi:synaptic vesicle membrane protein VAT-1